MTGSAPGPTLGNEYGKPLPFTFYSADCILQSRLNQINTVSLTSSSSCVHVSEVLVNITSTVVPVQPHAGVDNGSVLREDQQSQRGGT